MNKVKIPDICPVCCTIKSIMLKQNRFECSRCGATRPISDDDFSDITTEEITKIEGQI